ncbi:MAG: hypothetical protein WCV80_01485 [Candidatus Paceibacterota bacterium]|jgi:hypothetical protein
MKLITLNTLAGKLRDPLSQFLLKNKDVDIFCFQEIFHNLDETTRTTDFIFEEGGNEKLFDEIQSILTNHIGYFCPIHGGFYGLAIFVKKGMEVLATSEICLYENKAYTPEDESDHGRKLQWLRVKNGKEMLIMNVHGHWAGTGKGDNEIFRIGTGKGDNEIRLLQSERILTFLN